MFAYLFGFSKGGSWEYQRMRKVVRPALDKWEAKWCQGAAKTPKTPFKGFGESRKQKESSS